MTGVQTCALPISPGLTGFGVTGVLVSGFVDAVAPAVKLTPPVSCPTGALVPVPVFFGGVRCVLLDGGNISLVKRESQVSRK